MRGTHAIQSYDRGKENEGTLITKAEILRILKARLRCLPIRKHSIKDQVTVLSGTKSFCPQRFGECCGIIALQVDGGLGIFA